MVAVSLGLYFSLKPFMYRFARGREIDGCPTHGMRLCEGERAQDASFMALTLADIAEPRPRAVFMTLPPYTRTRKGEVHSLRVPAVDRITKEKERENTDGPDIARPTGKHGAPDWFLA
jgi:hypothetical protein